MSPALSIVIPTNNSVTEKNGCIFFALASINNTTDLEIEVIVVNDGGTDSTTREIRKAYPDIVIVDAKSNGNNAGRARNIGAQAARSKKILFLDDDTILVQPGHLAVVAEELDHVEFACGAMRYWSSVYWYHHVQRQQPSRASLNTLKDISFLPRGINRTNGFRDLNEYTFIGNFGAVRRSAFEAVGGFDSEFPDWGLEDTDLIMKLCLKGYNYSILAERGVEVVHLTHPTVYLAGYLRNMERFDRLQEERGYYFHVNHFFRVYEGDGFSLFTPIAD